jgi:hypothetical protein
LPAGAIVAENGLCKRQTMMALSYIIRKNLEVLRNRIKLSELVDIFMDNFYKVLPASMVKPIHEVLSDLVDELIWL